MLFSLFWITLYFRQAFLVSLSTVHPVLSCLFVQVLSSSVHLDVLTSRDTFLILFTSSRLFTQGIYIIYVHCIPHNGTYTGSCLTLLSRHALQPNRLLCPWNFPGKNTEVGCHPSPVDLHDTGIDSASPVSPILAGEFFTIEPPGKPIPYNILS